MKSLNDALREIARLFESMGVRYAVMGGIAVRIHAIPRPTFDVDFTVALARDRLAEFFERASSAGYAVPESYPHRRVDTVAGMSLVKLRMFQESRGVDIDIFLAESPFQETLLGRRRHEEIEGDSICFVSPEDLVLLKLLAGRPRDLIDIQDVLFTQGNLDEAYLRHWARELGVVERLERALANEGQ